MTHHHHDPGRACIVTGPLYLIHSPQFNLVIPTAPFICGPQPTPPLRARARFRCLRATTFHRVWKKWLCCAFSSEVLSESNTTSSTYFFMPVSRARTYNRAVQQGGPLHEVSMSLKLLFDLALLRNTTTAVQNPNAVQQHSHDTPSKVVGSHYEGYKSA